MSNPGKQQEALVKNADQTERLVEVISNLSEKIEKQHNDNVTSQRIMLASTIIMTLATVVLAFK